jgi:hypothetical protein
VLGKKGKGMWLRGELLLSMSEAMVSIPSTISFVYLPTYLQDSAPDPDKDPSECLHVGSASPEPALRLAPTL